MSANNIYGGGGVGGGRRGRSAMASVDFYRRVPKDLTEVSSGETEGEHFVVVTVADAACREKIFGAGRY